jgi:hypothetical protein
MSRAALRTLNAGWAALALACGPKITAQAPSFDTTFVFSAQGLSPRSLSVAHLGCVLVENADASSHDVTADDLTTCPELRGSITLAPGDSWDWCGFRGPKTCGFHDSTQLDASGAPDPRFAATIDVAAP